jgi:NACHT domain
MAEVFDELDETMLVLGTPGSGKTPMMAELARELLRRATTDSQKPIPVVLMLSSWTLHRERLDAWIVRELVDRYRIRHDQARNLLNTDQLILLLDGLDEVAKNDQPKCVIAINNFRAERGVTNALWCAAAPPSTNSCGSRCGPTARSPSSPSPGSKSRTSSPVPATRWP